MTLVRMTVREFSLGSILVAATEKGICAILLGDAPEALIAELREAFPTERFIEGDEDFDRLADDVVENELSRPRKDHAGQAADQNQQQTSG